MESRQSPTERQRLPILALLTGTGISIVGSVMTLIAVPWFVLQTTGSPAKTGVTTAVWVLPVILSGALAGPIVDRAGHKRAGILGDVGAGLCVALVPTLYHSVGLAFPLLLVIVFARGLFDFPGRTGRRSLVPHLADLAGWPLERANSAFATIQNLALLLGPALAGLLVARFSPSNVMWLDGVTYAFSAAMTALFVPSRPTTVSTQERYRERLLAGYRFVRQDRLLLTLLVFVTVNTFLTSPLFDVELPVFARNVFGSAVALGLMSAGFGAGSLASSFLYGMAGHRLPRRSVLLGSVLLTAAAIGCLTLEPSRPIAVLILTVTGFAAGPIGPLYQTVVQERVTTEMRGRVFGLSGVTFTAMPLGVLGSGFLIQAGGVRLTLAVQAFAILAAAIALALVPALRTLERPDDASVQPEVPERIDLATPTPLDSRPAASNLAVIRPRNARVPPSGERQRPEPIELGGPPMPDEHEDKSSERAPKIARERRLTSQTRGGWLDEVIRRAEADGQFHNLPGAGKPLPKSNPYESLDEWAMAHHMLKQSGFLPPWLQLRKEIAEEKPAVVAALEEYRRQRMLLDSDDPAQATTLRRLAERYATLARQINQKIDEHNFLRPSAMPELVRFQEDAVKG